MTPHHDPPEPRYPLAPLAAALGVTLGQIGGHRPGQEPTGITALAERFGCSTRWVKHLHRHGLPWDLADELACRHAGGPAWTIWPDWITNCPDTPARQPTFFDLLFDLDHAAA